MAKLPGIITAVVRRFVTHPLIQRVVRNTSYLFSAQGVSAALSMGQGILTARLLGVEGVALVGIITQFSSNLNQLISFRMHELVISYIGDFTAREKPRFAAATFKAAAFTELVGSVVGYLLIFSLAPLGAQIFAHQPDLAGLFRLYGLFVLGSLFAESASGMLQYFDRYRSLAFLTVGQSVLTILLIARAFLFKGTLSDVVIAYMVGKIVWGLSVTLLAVREAGRQWGSDWWRAPVSLLAPWRKELVRFGVSTNLSGTLKLITRDSEILWLGAFSNPLQVGYYKIAKAITNILMMPVTPLISTTYREVAREIAAKQWENVRYLLRSGALLASLWTLPASIGLVLFGRWVVGLYGVEFLPNSYINLLILLVGVIPANILYWNQLVLLPLGMPDYPTKVQFVVSIGKIAGTILLVPLYGANAMAWLLSGYLLLSTFTLVAKSMREITRVESVPLPSSAG
ncbi:MAG: oligosaccharide flippase family protein [Anaerolineales bacterium]|jgi:O-antigen/teichoic acid export membrane protein